MATVDCICDCLDDLARTELTFQKAVLELLCDILEEIETLSGTPGE